MTKSSDNKSSKTRSKSESDRAKYLGKADTQRIREIKSKLRKVENHNPLRTEFLNAWVIFHRKL